MLSALQMSQTEQDAANGNVAKRTKSSLANGAHSRVLPSEGNVTSLWSFGNLYLEGYLLNVVPVFHTCVCLSSLFDIPYL